MYSVGTDIVKISRIKDLIADNPRFFEKYYSSSELNELKIRDFNEQTASGMFCAKEAFSKALGTGVRGFSLCEVSLLHEPSGEPYLKLSGRAEQIAKEKNLDFDVSISHDGEYAIAVVIAFATE